MSTNQIILAIVMIVIFMILLLVVFGSSGSTSRPIRIYNCRRRRY